MAKRLIDIAIAILVLIFAAPLMLLIALAIRWESPGPAFFKQRRVGENGRLFSMWKIRTMVHNADELLPAVLAEMEDGLP